MSRKGIGSATIYDIKDGADNIGTSIVPVGSELFAFSKNISGSQGATPAGSSALYSRRDGEGPFGESCIAIESPNNKIIYPGLESQINWDEFSVLLWVKRLVINGTHNMFFGTWPKQYFSLNTNNKFVYSFMNTVQQSSVSTLGIDEINNWHLIGIAVDKVNSKVTFFKDNSFEDKTITINYTGAPVSFMLGDIGTIQYPANCLFNNMVVYKDSVITPTYVSSVYTAQKPFIDINAKTVVPTPIAPEMAVIDDYIPTGYVPDGYFTYL